VGVGVEDGVAVPVVVVVGLDVAVGPASSPDAVSTPAGVDVAVGAVVPSTVSARAADGRIP
jgi:hypothetical protein